MKTAKWYSLSNFNPHFQSMADDVSKMTAEEIEQNMRGFGEYLAKMLHVSNLSDEQKVAWSVLVPEMTMDQLGRFANVLQTYVNPEMQADLAGLREKLQAIKTDYEAKLTAIAREAESNLADVMNQAQAANAAAKV